MGVAERWSRSGLVVLVSLCELYSVEVEMSCVERGDDCIGFGFGIPYVNCYRDRHLR